MTTITTNPIHSHSQSSQGGTIAIIKARMINGFRAISKQRARKRDAAHMSELSDHLLRDIGLTRDQIPHAVHGEIDVVRVATSEVFQTGRTRFAPPK